MPFKPGDKKLPHSGKKRGTRNKKTQNILDRAEELGTDPFEVLIRVAGNDWEGLGYTSGTQTYYTPQGLPYEIDRIEISDRVHAAKEACKYLYSQRKALDVTSGGETLNSFSAAMKEALKGIDPKDK